MKFVDIFVLHVKHESVKFLPDSISNKMCVLSLRTIYHEKVDPILVSATVFYEEKGSDCFKLADPP